MISLHNMLPFELTKDTPYLALSGELWSVFHEYFNRNWSCYKGFLLYVCMCVPVCRQCELHGYFPVVVICVNDHCQVNINTINSSRCLILSGQCHTHLFTGNAWNEYRSLLDDVTRKKNLTFKGRYTYRCERRRNNNGSKSKGKKGGGDFHLWKWALTSSAFTIWCCMLSNHPRESAFEVSLVFHYHKCFH